MLIATLRISIESEVALGFLDHLSKHDLMAVPGLRGHPKLHPVLIQLLSTESKDYIYQDLRSQCERSRCRTEGRQEFRHRKKEQDGVAPQVNKKTGKVSELEALPVFYAAYMPATSIVWTIQTIQNASPSLSHTHL
jgi:hypothetical protein